MYVHATWAIIPNQWKRENFQSKWNVQQNGKFIILFEDMLSHSLPNQRDKPWRRPTDDGMWLSPEVNAFSTVDFRNPVEWTALELYNQRLVIKSGSKKQEQTK